MQSNAMAKPDVAAQLDQLQTVALTLVREIKSLGYTAANVDVQHGISYYDEVRRYETKLIRQALNITNGNQVRAAHLLGLSATTLNSIIKRYKILPLDAPQPDEPHLDERHSDEL